MAARSVRKLGILKLVLFFILLFCWTFVLLGITNHILPTLTITLPIFFTLTLVPLLFIMSGEVITVEDGVLKRVNRKGDTVRRIPLTDITDIYGYQPNNDVQLLKQRIAIKEKGVVSIDFDLFLYELKDVQAILDEIEKANSTIRYHRK